MDKREELKKELQELIKEATELANLAAGAKSAAGIVKFGMQYQNWYTKSLKVVEVLAADRLEDFISYYSIDKKRKLSDQEITTVMSLCDPIYQQAKKLITIGQ